MFSETNQSPDTTAQPSTPPIADSPAQPPETAAQPEGQPALAGETGGKEVSSEKTEETAVSTIAETQAPATPTAAGPVMVPLVEDPESGASVPCEELGHAWPLYRSHKLVHAAKIKSITGAIVEVEGERGETARIFQMSYAWLARHYPQVGGFVVLYPDGYYSYSPHDAFVLGYKLCDAAEPVPQVSREAAQDAAAAAMRNATAPQDLRALRDLQNTAAPKESIEDFCVRVTLNTLALNLPVVPARTLWLAMTALEQMRPGIASAIQEFFE